MNSRNTTAKQLKRILIATIFILSCIITSVYATTSTNVQTNLTNTLPYIEMKVKSTGNNQILVEAWGSNFTCLEGLEIVFTYDNTKLTPSKITDNSEITDLNSIKYDNRPTSSEAQVAFDEASKNVLSNSFAFDSAYDNMLGIDIFKYLAPSGSNEAIQFIISRKDYLTNINATDPVLLGAFSFKQTENTSLDETEFTTKRIKIYCDDGLTDEDYSFYTREETNGEDCTEIVEFTYAKYGSISGTIAIDVKNTKNIATIKIFEKGKTMDWTNLTNYQANRLNLPKADYEYTTLDSDNGVFCIDNIPYGEYEILVEKDNYLDYVITNVIIDSSNECIDLDTLIGDIKLLPGDYNKDGKITLKDKTTFDTGYKEKPKNHSLDLSDDDKLTLSDKTVFDTLYKKIPKDKRTLIILGN